MHLQEAQETVWSQQNPAPQTTQEALGRLLKTVQGALESFESDQLVQAQMGLEDGLVQVLVAMRTLGLDPERGLMRAMTRMRQTPGKRIFLIYPDRVEIRVSGEYRGGWPLYTDDDYAATLQVARELRCDIVHTDAKQMDLFQADLPGIAEFAPVPEGSESEIEDHSAEALVSMLPV